MRGFAIFIVLACLAAGPATMPTTRPASDDDTTQRLLAAMDNLHRVTALRTAQAAQEPRVAELQRKLNDAIARRDTLKSAASDPESAKALLATVQEISDLRHQFKDAYDGVLAGYPDLVAARREVDRIEAARQAKRDTADELERAKQRQADSAKAKQQADPIWTAIREHRPVLGMTLDQVQKALVPAKLTRTFEAMDGGRHLWSSTKRIPTRPGWRRAVTAISSSMPTVSPSTLVRAK